MPSDFSSLPLALLVAAPLLLGSGMAQAANNTVIASACDVTGPYLSPAVRSWGISNPLDGLLQVSCPLPHGNGAVGSYQVYATVAPGLMMNCSLRHLRKQDGALLHMFSFAITGSNLPYLLVPNAARSADAVGELLCMLPGKHRGRLHAIEAFSFN